MSNITNNPQFLQSGFADYCFLTLWLEFDIWVKCLNKWTIFGYFVIVHVSGIIGISCKIAIFINIVYLYVHNPFKKYFSISFLIYMSVSPVKVNALFAVDIHFPLNDIPIFVYAKIHI